MRKHLSGIKAAKQVKFADTCHTGAFAAQFAGRGAAEENVLAELIRQPVQRFRLSPPKIRYGIQGTET